MTYPLVANIDLVVRVHANSLAGIQFNLKADPIPMPNPPCQYISGQVYQGATYKMQSGNTDVLGNEGNLPVLKQLVSSQPDGDWKLERYRFVFPINSNKFQPPCITSLRFSNITMRDTAGRFKSILINYGSTTFYEMLGVRVPEQARLLLPEIACPNAGVSEFRSSPLACAESTDISKVVEQFTQAEIDMAVLKAAADKAAADKAAADKAAADKAAADKAAADKAAADKAAADKAKRRKEITITCVKGKSSLKILGNNPKCPSGYKKK
jgi:hypothetical protein